MRFFEGVNLLINTLNELFTFSNTLLPYLLLVSRIKKNETKKDSPNNEKNTP